MYPLLQFDEGIRYHMDGKLKEAVVLLNSGLNINSSDLPTLIELGQIFTELTKYDLAISTLTQAVKMSSSDPLIHLLLGNAYLESNDVNKAIEEYKIVVKLEPENILLLSDLGIACLLNSDFQCAINNLGKVVVAYPYNLRSRLALAIAYHYLKEYSLSKEQYKVILKYEPYHYAIWYNLAKTEIALVDYESAINSINNAISINSSLSELYLDRAFLSYKLGRSQEAENDYLLAIKSDPVNPDCVIEYALFLWKTGSYLKAASEFDKAIHLEMDNKNLLVYKAFLLQRSQKYDEAIKTWNEVLNEEKDNKIASFNLARAYHEKGNFSKEIELYQNLLSLVENAENQEERHKLKQNLACALHKNKDLDKARSLYEEVLTKEPDNSKLLFNYGLLLNMQERYNEAVSYLEKAIEKKYENPPLVYKELVKSYLNLNDNEKLKNTYKRWLDIEAGNFNTRVEYAKFLTKIGNTQEAISEYRIAITLGGNDNSKALIPLANMYKDLGMYEDAISTYKKIILLQHGNFLAYYNLGILCQMSEKLQEAQNYLLKSIELNEKYSPAYYALGLTYVKSSDLQKAKEMFQRYLEMDPQGEYGAYVEIKLKEIAGEESKAETSKA